MPLYEYECDSCAHRFEVIQKFSDALADKCPKCGSTVHKLFSSPAIQFKGSGWYITDYAKKDSSAAGKPGASKEDAPASKDGGASTTDTASKGTDAAPAAAASAPAAAAPASSSKAD